MNRNTKLAMASAVLVSLTIATHAGHATASDEQLLAKGAIPDVTPQQKYQTAIREAGGAYKEWLRDCMQYNGADKISCRREAKAVYDRDMAEAKRILRNS